MSDISISESRAVMPGLLGVVAWVSKASSRESLGTSLVIVSYQPK